MTDLAESLVTRGVSVTALAGRGLYNGGKALPPEADYRGIKIVRAGRLASAGPQQSLAYLTTSRSIWAQLGSCLPCAGTTS